MSDATLAKLEKAVGKIESQSLFTSSTYLGKDGGIENAKGQVTINHPKRSWFGDSVTIGGGVWILKHLEEFKAALLRAAEMAERDGEVDRLRKAKAEKAKAKANKGKRQASSNIDDDIARLESQA